MGRDIGDPVPYTKWRDEARRQNVDLIDFYGRFLIGQHAGMTEALALPSVVAAFRISCVPRRSWANVTDRLNILHAAFIEHRRENK